MAGKLEQLSVDKNGNIKRGKTKPKKSKNSKKNNILAKNKAKGRAFEKQEFAQFKSSYVVGKGKGIFSKGYKIPPDTNINIIRP